MLALVVADDEEIGDRVKRRKEVDVMLDKTLGEHTNAGKRTASGYSLVAIVCVEPGLAQPCDRGVVVLGSQLTEPLGDSNRTAQRELAFAACFLSR